MTAQTVEHQGHDVPPARTLDAITHAIEGCGHPDVVVKFETALGRAWADARERDSLTPLLDLVESWWPEAALWTLDPHGARRACASAEQVLREGLSPEQQARLEAHPEGMTRERAIASWEAANGRPMVL